MSPAANASLKSHVEPQPTPIQKVNTPPDVINVTLDKTIVDQWCPVSKSPNAECPFNGEKVRIESEATDKDGDVIEYFYEVTGGRIVGQGPNVVWDLTNLRVGDYLVTVRAGDGGLKKGRTITKTVKLQECPVCDLPCVCPALAVSTPTTFVFAGEIVTFTLNTSDPETIRREVNWSISAGKIIGGQGTKQLRVKTTPEMARSNLKASAEIEDPCSGGCVRLASGTVEIKDAQKRGSAQADNANAILIKLNLSKEVVYLPCRPGLNARYRDCPDGVTVSVHTIAKAGYKPLNYEYAVAYGKIVGSGANVTWDLSGLSSGTYQITARVSYGAKAIGSPVTKKVKVFECPGCNADCLKCPRISVSSSKTSIVAGKAVAFKAEAEIEEYGKVAYRWDVSGGQITKGQGTSRITVKAFSNNRGGSVNAELHVKGEGLCWDVCPTTASGKVTVIVPKKRSKH